MINKVFCYSQDEAKKYGNGGSLAKDALICFTIVLLVAGVMYVFSGSSAVIGIAGFIGIFCIMFYCGIREGIRKRPQIMTFALDTDNNLYCVVKKLDRICYIDGVYEIDILKTLMENGEFVSNIMNYPEIVAKMVESAKTTEGVEVRQILKVHDYAQKSKSVNIRCDYKIMNTEKIMYNQKIIIYKAYDCFDDLMKLVLHINCETENQSNL